MKTAMDNIQQCQGNKGEIAFEEGLKYEFSGGLQKVKAQKLCLKISRTVWDTVLPDWGQTLAAHGVSILSPLQSEADLLKYANFALPNRTFFKKKNLLGSYVHRIKTPGTPRMITNNR